SSSVIAPSKSAGAASTGGSPFSRAIAPPLLGVLRLNRAPPRTNRGDPRVGFAPGELDREVVAGPESVRGTQQRTVRRAHEAIAAIHHAARRKGTEPRLAGLEVPPVLEDEG